MLHDRLNTLAFSLSEDVSEDEQSDEEFEEERENGNHIPAGEENFDVTRDGCVGDILSSFGRLDWSYYYTNILR